jgi:hypothetical protein
MHDVWHVVYGYTVAGRDYTVFGERDFLDEDAAEAESRSGTPIDIKYLENDPEAALGLDAD